MTLKDWKKVGIRSWRNNKNKKILSIIRETYGKYNFYSLKLNKDIILEHQFGSSEPITKLSDIIYEAKAYMREH